MWVTKPGIAYKLYMYQGANGYGVFVDGGVSQRFLTASQKVSEGLDFYVEKMEFGYAFYTMIDGKRMYVNVTYNELGKVAVLYQEEAVSAYGYNDEIGTWVTDFNGSDYYLGSYSSYDTISASSISYINAENTGITQFPLQLVECK